MKLIIEPMAKKLLLHVGDAPATVGVAAWAYGHNAALGAPAWLSGEIVEPLSGRWRSLLALRSPIP